VLRGVRLRQVRGIGAAGSGPRRCAIAQEAAGHAAPTCGETPITSPPCRYIPQLVQRFSVHILRTLRAWPLAGRLGAPKVRP